MIPNIKKTLVLFFLFAGLFQLTVAQVSKRYYEKQKLTFNKSNSAYTPQMLIEDFGNGSFFSTDRQNAAIVDGTYQIKFPKGQKVSNTGAAAVPSIPKKQQYTMEYLIKYDTNFEAGLHGKQFGFSLGAGYSGGSSQSCRENGDGGTIRLQFDAHEGYISNQLYAYYSDMTAETYGENPGGQSFTMQRGVWNKIRMTVTLESSYAAQDARIEVWCNDIKGIDVTGLSLVRVDASRYIGGLCFESFPGGGGEYPTYDNYLYLDDLTWYSGNDGAAFTQAPGELYMKGSALAEYSTPVKMQRIIEDFPKSYNNNQLLGNTFELITALKTGQYSFSISANGEDAIQPENITVENPDEENLVPYRIQVNYDGSAPVVSVQKISGVVLFAPSKKYTVAGLNYLGNSAFEVEEIQYNLTAWGDPRYRIRMLMDDGGKATYGYVSGSVSAPNDDSNTSGYFELYPTTNVDDWTETVDGTKYTGNEFKLSPKRRGEGFALEPFSVKVIFNSSAPYYHTIRDFGAQTFEGAPENLFMRGTALAESSEPVAMKRINKDFPASYNGAMVQSNIYELITGLKTGQYEFAVASDGDAVISPQSITVSNTSGSELIPYRIRVNFDQEIPLVTVSKVDRVIMWAPSKKYTIATFDYTGNFTFEKEQIEFVKSSWGDERYRIRLYTEDGSLTTYAYKSGNLTAPDNDSNENGYFDLYTTTNVDGWNESPYTGAEFKLSRKRRGEGFELKPFNVKITWGATANYTHIISDYVPAATNIISPNKGNVKVYPSLIENTVTFIAEESGFSVEFISLVGTTVLKAETDSRILTLNSVNIEKGVYLTKIIKNEKILAIEKVVKL